MSYDLPWLTSLAKNWWTIWKSLPFSYYSPERKWVSFHCFPSQGTKKASYSVHKPLISLQSTFPELFFQKITFFQRPKQFKKIGTK